MCGHLRGTTPLLPFESQHQEVRALAGGPASLLIVRTRMCGLLRGNCIKHMVPERGLEPPRPKSLPPQGSASTNSAIRAKLVQFNSPATGGRVAANGFASKRSGHASPACGRQTCVERTPNPKIVTGDQPPLLPGFAPLPVFDVGIAGVGAGIAGAELPGATLVGTAFAGALLAGWPEAGCVTDGSGTADVGTGTAGTGAGTAPFGRGGIVALGTAVARPITPRSSAGDLAPCGLLA